MGLLQKAVQTYDAYSRMKDVELPPLYHSVKNADIIITIDKNGSILDARDDKTEIIFPTTQKSQTRTSTSNYPHPLCDQIKYLANYGRNSEYYNKYIKQLTEWSDSVYTHPKLNAILLYIKSGTILHDLQYRGLIELDNNGTPLRKKNNNGKYEETESKKFIAWIIAGLGEDIEECWKDRLLFESYIKYYDNIISPSNNAGYDVDMISGDITEIAELHPKCIVNHYSNAKIISSNDDVNFTYRGRFVNSRQALTIGYESSQKAHILLSWLSSNQSVATCYNGGRTYICWNPNGIQIPKTNFSFWEEAEDPKPTNYKEQLRKLLLNYKYKIPINEDVVIVSFDATIKTSGRLSVTYYNTLKASDFLDRIEKWDLSSCWIHENGKVNSPSMPDIVKYAFGKEDSKKKIIIDDKVFDTHIQRLISCKVDQAVMPMDIMEALFRKSCNPFELTEDHKNNVFNRSNLLFIACAVVKKYRYDHFKEEWQMALEPDKHDISYQYGRLLAVFEKIERIDINKKRDDREPNAIRMWSAYCRRPDYIASLLKKKIIIYQRRLTPGSRYYYDNLIGEIYEKISTFSDNEIKKPLKETYLIGYYLQKNNLNNNNNKDIQDTDSSNTRIDQ